MCVCIHQIEVERLLRRRLKVIFKKKTPFPLGGVDNGVAFFVVVLPITKTLILIAEK